MKDLNEILSHLATIDKIDGHADANAYDRRRAVGVLAWNIVDELIAGRPAPGTRDVARFTRIEGLVPRLADELVEHHAEAIAHRTHLAERLEADGGENGAKAAAILRGMNAAAEPSKEDDLPTSGDLWPPRPTFQIHFLKTHGEGGGGCGVPVAGSGAGGGGGGSCQGITDRTARYHAHEAARREHALAKAAQERIRAAELRGFYKGRDKAWTIVMNRLAMMPGLHEDGQAVLRAVSESIAMMQKEG